MAKNKLLRLIDTFDEISKSDEFKNEYKRLLENPDNVEIDLFPRVNEWNETAQETQNYLIEFPGELIPVNRAIDVEHYKSRIGHILSTVKEDEWLENLLDFSSNETVSLFINEFIKNARHLRPVFISVNYKSRDFIKYISESFRAWSYGLYNSSMIIMHSVVEEALRNSLFNNFHSEYSNLYELNGEAWIATDKLKMWELRVEALNKKLITNIDDEFLKKFSEERNGAIHRLEDFATEERKLEVLDRLKKSAEIIEKLYK